MRIRTWLWLVALLFVQVPLTAAAQDIDVPYCGTPPLPHWWWLKDGLPEKIAIDDWEVRRSGDGYVLSFVVTNITDAILDAGQPFTLSHAAVDAVGHPDPSSLGPPAADSLLGAETLVQGRLPTLAPGQSTRLRAEIRSSPADANHILTLAVVDGELSRATNGRTTTPWFWTRVIDQGSATARVRVVSTSVTTTPSRLPGYEARHVSITLQNVGRTALPEGTPVAFVQSSAASAAGIWSPEDDKDPNDPGNPYAVIFRAVPFRGALERALAPGDTYTIEGTVALPPGPCIQQLVVNVGR
ncbi:hypothetical protein LZ198_32855 [Myxococcus sp. K15C18031901]|uniref:hypothetical protein n=1 Tax=Myxococcus dinghuensis TaxID=2906761 RepID=UPI0020A76E52|nr:hypothetical protein [Myxococcus dinghuensis]MCP3103684.1 hypothetical protein [Myxococcus dinghuensis]